MGKREGNGGTRGRGDKAEREREEGKRYGGRGRKRRRNKGKCMYVGIVGERQMEGKGRNCRDSTRGKERAWKGRRGKTGGTAQEV